MSKTNILFTCAGRRNYIIKYFKETLKGDGNIVAADMQLTAPALSDADKAYIVPPVDSDSYINELLEICKKEEIRAIISLNDLELPVLSSNKSCFDEIGVRVIISNGQVIDICFDKWKTIEFAKGNNIKVPMTFLNYEALTNYLDSKSIEFPLVVKPRWGSASIGIEFPDNEYELELCYKLVKEKLKKSILANAGSSDPKNTILFQEKIIGKEYGIDVLNNFDGKPVKVYVKEKLAMRAGETDKAVLRNIPELEKMGYTIGTSLGHIGNLDIDVFEKDGKYYLLEMNPRFGGGYPFSHMSGANYPKALISWLEDKDYNCEDFSHNYDQVFSKCDTLIKVKI